MGSVIEYANNGGKVLGICNGFQVLTEAGLLPGALKRNKHLHFISRHHNLKVATTENTFLQKCEKNAVLNIPIAHHDGNFFIDESGLKSLYDNDQVLLHYCDKNGTVSNPNGSVDSIAGITNIQKNVFGLMPHPERAMEALLGSDDGRKMLEGFLTA
jgi:phosphoribosylformylglycinamidine synthase